MAGGFAGLAVSLWLTQLRFVSPPMSGSPPRRRAAGMSVLLVEQELAAALPVADRVAVLERGVWTFEAPVRGLDRSVLEDLLLPV